MTGDDTFARRLREFRLQAGMTQQQLADVMTRTGNRIHRSTIGKIESGARPVTIGEAVQLAGILGVPLTEMVTGTGTDAARIEAQLTVTSRKSEADERDRLLREAQILADHAAGRLKAAEQRLAELDGTTTDPASDPPPRDPHSTLNAVTERAPAHQPANRRHTTSQPFGFRTQA